MAHWTERLDRAVAASPFGRRFRLDRSGHRRERKGSRFSTEIRAGLATFFAMAYIISVNATILTDSGGTCVCTDAKDLTCAGNVEYNLCLDVIRRDLITATAAIAALSTFCMGLFANMPIALAPGMGLNAYFAYNVVGFHGTGPVPYRLALTAVFIEGFVFVGLSVLGLRQWLARAIPRSIKLASSVGIGLYLSLIGLTYSAGIGAITGDTSTPLVIAGCRQSDLIKGAIIAGILLVSIISWPRDTSITYFPHTPEGDNSFDFFKKVVTFHQIEKTLNAQNFDLDGVSGQLGLAFITFLYVDILDCTGTLYSMARFAGAIDEETQDFEGSAVAYLVDAFSISIGSLFGSSPVTAFVESGAGISEGGATGITAMVTGLCFFISVFFAPIFASIPPWATGCTLVLVGAMMTKAAPEINWLYLGDAVPAFVTLAVMPFTYSIAYGLISGIVTYMILNTFTWLVDKASGGRITPANRHLKDPWTYKIPGGVLPAWIVRLAHGKIDFWREYPKEVRITSSLYALSLRGVAPETVVALDPVVGLVDDQNLALWPSIAVLFLLVLLLLTFAVLPASATERHYLTTSPLLGFLLMSIAFLIPSKDKPQECYDAITPHDLRSDARCGSMAVALFLGIWVVIIGCFFRTIALFLSVCCEIKPGQKFKIISLTVTFLGSAVLVVITLTITGAAYTFGKICYLIPHHDRGTFWGLLLAVTAMSLLFQILTVGYCIYIVAKPFHDDYKLRKHGHRPAIEQHRMMIAHQTALRIRKILQMQWRAILITFLISVYVIYIAVVLLRLHQFSDYPSAVTHSWFECLASSGGDKKRCLPLADSIGPNESELLAVGVMLVISGLLAVLIIPRTTMYYAWRDLLAEWLYPIRAKLRPPRDDDESINDGSDVEAAGLRNLGTGQMPPSLISETDSMCICPFGRKSH
ncbi:hypothetical protein UREG_07549 [Paecilomyces variotii No. 5]|uniref:Uncharacterized protein n=1 Tax=Byssochlamys spectabilis (strain No. 5 / NBRC 109023) TaxID=1356009 RepID=V5FXH7_BYSSN|nr:hypothetical protein UREG_07549 [Paecilomyces variotii No. 5]